MSSVFLLNSSYEPLSVVSLQRAIRLIFAGKAEVVSQCDQMVSSPTYAIRMPSIIRMLYFIRRPRAKVSLTKKNILLRDDNTCQYCNTRVDRLLTIDHVQPKSRGGTSTWENLVAACARCNNRKNNRTPEEARMQLLRKPREPKYIPWIRIQRNTLPDEWHKFLFYDVRIEERIE